MENAFAGEITVQIRGWANGLRAIVAASARVMRHASRPLDCLHHDGWQKSANFPYLSADSG
jgi:hypothetical protein